MGLNLKKKFKRSAKSLKKLGKKAIDVQMKLYTGGKYGQKEAGKTYKDMSGKTAAEAAEKQAVEQQAVVAKQEAMIAEKQKKADDEAAERKRRTSQRQLLSGSERGVMKPKVGSLLSSSR